jgi:TetR/AcrR family tetracycline transcriptional repressor
LALQRQPADGTAAATLWFSPPTARGKRRRQLTRERVAAEALALIGADGVAALSMRALAARLGVVPGALYRHVRSKEQLYDLVLDGVLGEVGTRGDPALTWSEQVVTLALQLRTVLEDHPGIAGLLKARDPISPNSIALAEAFLAPLDAAGLPERQTAQAFRLIYDYTLGFALGDRSSPGEQLIRDSATRDELHAFLRALPPDQYPAVAGLGEHIWTADRDEQFSAGLATIIAGLQAS